MPQHQPAGILRSRRGPCLCWLPRGRLVPPACTQQDPAGPSSSIPCCRALGGQPRGTPRPGLHSSSEPLFQARQVSDDRHCHPRGTPQPSPSPLKPGRTKKTGVKIPPTTKHAPCRALGQAPSMRLCFRSPKASIVDHSDIHWASTVCQAQTPSGQLSRWPG